MSSSRKKKTNKQLKTYLAILASVLAVLVLLALILTLGRYTSEPPVETEPSETIPPETTTEATEFTYDETFPTDPAVDSRLGIDVSEHQKNIDWGQGRRRGLCHDPAGLPGIYRRPAVHGQLLCPALPGR